MQVWPRWPSNKPRWASMQPLAGGGTNLLECECNLGEPTHTLVPCWMPKPAGAKQPVHLLLGGKGLGIQRGASVWVRSPKYAETLAFKG